MSSVLTQGCHEIEQGFQSRGKLSFFRISKPKIECWIYDNTQLSNCLKNELINIWLVLCKLYLSIITNYSFFLILFFDIADFLDIWKSFFIQWNIIPMIRWISCNTCSTVNCHYIVICEFHLLFSLIIASSVSIIVYNGYNPVYLDFASNIIYHRSLSISCIH